MRSPSADTTRPLKMVFTGRWVVLGLQGMLKRTHMVTKGEPYWSDSYPTWMTVWGTGMNGNEIV